MDRNWQLNVGTWSWGQFHKTKLSVCLLSSLDETYDEPNSIEMSFNESSEKFCQVEFSSEFLLHDIDPSS